jgi:hypothetical protein
VTSVHLPGTPSTIEERTAAFVALHAQLHQDVASAPPPSPRSVLDLDDATLLDKASRAANGTRFSALWSGDTSQHGGDDSAADLALCASLAFWTACDPDRMDALFRQSGLYREKWDARRGTATYGSRTIDKAIAGCHDTYQGHSSSPTTVDERDVHADAPTAPAPIAQTVRGFTAVELQCHTFEYRRPLLWRGDKPLLREGHLAEIYAVRGVGKTWLAMLLGYIAANPGTEALGFRSEEAANVLIVDGEMASPEVQERSRTTAQILGVAPSANITIVAADWQDHYLPRLDTPAGWQGIEPFVDAADLIILDNRSSLFDPEAEKDPTAWQPAQDWLLSLRRRRKAVVIVHHSNRQGGARGHSKPEDVMDLLIKLTRPEGYSAEEGARFTLEFDKARGVHGAALVPFTACLTPDGWQIEDGADENAASGKLREYLDLAHRAGERPKSANTAITRAHVNRNAGLRAWAALKHDGALQLHPDGGFYLA